MEKKVLRTILCPAKIFGQYLVLLMAILVLVPNLSFATITSVTWSSQQDFENNVTTNGPPATRLNIDTTSSPGDVKIGSSKELSNSPAIICATESNKIYSIGALQTSISVIDGLNKEIIATISIGKRPAGAVYNSRNKKVYIGHQDDDEVTVIDTATDTVIKTIVSGKGPFAALYNSTDNKVYVANLQEQSITVIEGTSDTVITKVPVIAGPYMAAYNPSDNKVFISNKYNNSVSIIDGATNQIVKTVVVEPVIGLIGGQTSGNVGLQLDTYSKMIYSADTMTLKWNYERLLTDQHIRFQVRTATEAALLDAAEYKGPDGTANTWYESTISGAETTPEPDGSFTTSIPLVNNPNFTFNIPFARYVEMQLKLSSDNTNTPILHEVSLVYDSNPNLTVLDVNGPVTGTIGESITIHSTVANNGTANAPAFQVELCLTKINTNEDIQCWIYPVNGLAAGASLTTNIPIVLPTSLKTGNYYFKAKADSTNQVAEVNETDNIKLGGPIDIYSMLPDLVVKNVSGTITNGTIVYTVTIKNQGLTTSNYTYANIYFSTDNTISFSDPYVTWIFIGPLASGAETTVTGAVNIPTEIPSGTYYIGAVVDTPNSVNEFDETNNTKAGNQITVSRDLTVSAVSGTITNGKLNYSATIKNVGNVATASTYLNIYLSTDNTISFSDHYVTAVFIVPLASGAETTVTGAIDIPTKIPSGTYYIGAVVDTPNSVNESDETNNTKAGNQTTVSRDLNVSAVSGTITNGKLNYSATINNVGNVATASTYLNIYLSTDNTISFSDHYVTAVFIGPLASGAETTVTGAVDIPTEIPNGTYYIGSIVDTPNSVNESDETNNTLAGNLIIKP